MKPIYSYINHRDWPKAADPRRVDVVRTDGGRTTIATSVTFVEAELAIQLDKTQLELAAARIAMKGSVAALSQPVMTAKLRTQNEKAHAYDILVGDVKAARSLLE